MSFDATLSFNISRRLHPGRSGPWLLAGPQGPGLMFGELSLHDAADPVTEAEGWVARAGLSRPDMEPSLALVFGLGLGYHLQVLRRRYQDIRLLVFEPLSDLRAFYEANKVLGPGDGPPPEIYTDWGEFEKIVSREVVYGEAGGVLMLAPEGYRGLRPEAFGAFKSLVEREVIRRSVIDKTREHSSGVFMENLARNAGRLCKLPDLMLLKGLLPARPAFIVGSGPSLSRSAAELGAVGDKGLIIAAASAVKPLLARGVSPDLVLILESEDTSSYLDLTEAEREVLGPNRILALASGCHPAHFEIAGFQKAVFHLNAGAAQVFSRGDFLPQGGNSGSAGFALAYAWGLDPLVLVGQDQAYEGGRLHAEGTPGEVDECGDLTIGGLDGTLVKTDSGLLASLGWFAEAARSIARQGRPPRLFNCSAGGAEVPGFIHSPLAVLAATLPPAGEPFDLSEVVPKIPLASRRETAADLEQLARVVGGLRRLVRMDYGRARAEVKSAGQISKFLALLLNDALAAPDRRELKEALNRADEIMTLMRSSLS